MIAVVVFMLLLNKCFLVPYACNASVESFASEYLHTNTNDVGGLTPPSYQCVGMLLCCFVYISLLEHQ